MATKGTLVLDRSSIAFVKTYKLVVLRRQVNLKWLITGIEDRRTQLTNAGVATLPARAWKRSAVPRTTAMSTK